MNRRELIQAVSGIVATPILATADAMTFHSGAQYQLNPNAKYLFVFSLGTRVDLQSLNHLGVQGTIIYVDDPEHDLKIYKVD